MRPYTYTAPATLEEAVRALSEAGPGTKVLAGGTTLFDLMKLDIETPPAVVDIRALPELAGIDTAGPRELTFGAGALMADVAADPLLRRDYPALAESLAKAASQQLRNMATVGGNLLQRTRCTYFRGGPPFPCNKRLPGSGCAAIGGLDRGHALLGGGDACVATYPGDWAVALIAFDAVLDVTGPRGTRTLPLAGLHVEPGERPDREHTLAWDEIVTRIRVPVTAAGRGSTYHKVRDRESYAFALASAAVAVTLGEGGAVEECRVAVGGVATRPWRCPSAEEELAGAVLDRRSARRAGAAAFAGARAGTHNAFRIELGIRTVAEALRIAGERALR
ncbi:xanthine dehydrogenase family protein subunit M [Nonomuraea sp. MG754425]|uniref:FAD binding domain-containing protein n=1 Tax=Nonomuraea sp. MG754425 TaxID=2570319 RepID=UPI001F2EF756|nr:xanthine dehydrogenase family protein subunit M [Nonomuraea sp. MG754425]MCF6471109.1 xanthine dehydrogenase family protein subunit M [Nonomuraea sp. MG754425]